MPEYPDPVTITPDCANTETDAERAATYAGMSILMGDEIRRLYKLFRDMRDRAHRDHDLPATYLLMIDDGLKNDPSNPRGAP